MEQRFVYFIIIPTNGIVNESVVLLHISLHYLLFTEVSLLLSHVVLTGVLDVRAVLVFHRFVIEARLIIILADKIVLFLKDITGHFYSQLS